MLRLLSQFEMGSWRSLPAAVDIHQNNDTYTMSQMLMDQFYSVVNFTTEYNDASYNKLLILTSIICCQSQDYVSQIWYADKRYFC